MNAILLLSVLIYFVITPCFGQNNTEKKTSFLNGIYIQNPNTLIPWGTSFNEIHKYGDPKIRIGRTNTLVTWDSVFIFDSIKITLHTFYDIKFMGKTPVGKIQRVEGSIDSVAIEKIKSILISVSGINPKVHTKKYGFYYQWSIDNCNVRVGFRKGRGAFFDIYTKTRFKS